MFKSLQAISWLALICLSTCSINCIEAKESYQDCISCHEGEFEQWQNSDHARSMAVPSDSSVVADFNNVTVSHHGQQAKFYRDDNGFMVDISYDNKSITYPIKYSFGYFPLQQFLVETEPGKLQVLPFSWDSRMTVDGGQRWYHNYSHEEIRPEDRLHWRQPLQNWNGMCADCHSDGLLRNYNPIENAFNTHFDNINIGCASCHGDMASHPTAEKLTSKKPGNWLRKNDEKTAIWQGESRDNKFMDNCFSCHSLRSPLTDGITPNKAYLDQFTPQLPTSPIYHVDGQIREEVYVYGSFLQSKMFASGVNCIDCHDKHSMKIKVEGNGLCLQCHSSDAYDVKQHHGHKQNSAGAQCTSCHMPTTRYMGTDDRLDHSFKIPRPDISKEFGTPNVCVDCHKTHTNKWAEVKLKSLHGKPEAISKTLRSYYLLQNGSLISLADHFAIVADNLLPVIFRSTALQLINRSTQNLSGDMLEPYLNHQQELIRLSATMVVNLLPENERVEKVTPLLKDKLKVIRVAAARGLVNMTLSSAHQQDYDKAYKELMMAADVNSWRGEGRANKAVMEFEQGHWIEAEKAFQAAIKIDPYFESGYINLAELYRHQNQLKLESEILKKALGIFPASAELRYAFGLHLVRQKQYGKATLHFKKAVELSPSVEQYAYTYILSLDRQGQTLQALNILKEIIQGYNNNQQLNQLGDYLYKKLKGR